jgi:hypothetical protein
VPHHGEPVVLGDKQVEFPVLMIGRDDDTDPVAADPLVLVAGETDRGDTGGTATLGDAAVCGTTGLLEVGVLDLVDWREREVRNETRARDISHGGCFQQFGRALGPARRPRRLARRPPESGTPPDDAENQ